MVYNRANLICDAAIDGLSKLNQLSAATIVGYCHFEIVEDRIIVRCPRPLDQKEFPASKDLQRHLLRIINLGIKFHGFRDEVIIEP